ncbi:18476_t:CDS:2 [Dentiscutata erythropus]|uniref:18476_t:CDS:1 n=1 Tax=Dentiscutata erythropus TaxID=1348616 RepID=A0A9N9C3E3_9GLOM|nr:18476_t:CDS:2 [Dentiscutata erythropus]
MENINYNESFLDPYFSNSESESANEIENFSILNFETDTYQSVKNKILQQNSNNENEDYDLNNEAEENIIEFDETTDEIILNQSCLEDNGGHLHQRLSRGVSEFGCDSKHDDLTVILEKFGNWIQLVAKSDNKLQKQQLIWLLLPMIETLKLHVPQDLQNHLSAKTKAEHLKEKECAYFGNLLGESLWQSHILLKNDLPILEIYSLLNNMLKHCPELCGPFLYRL